MKKIKKFILFCFAGGIGALTEIVFFNLFFLFSVFFISKFFALVFALSINFSINRNLTFSAKNERRRKQIPRYVLLYSFSTIINYFFSVFLNSILGGGLFYANLSVIAGILIGIPINFFGSLYWVFKIKNK